MEGTRLRILQILQKNGNETVEGIARPIGLAPATIRRHLDILQRDRLVSFKEARKRTGRPEHSFFLTEEGQEALPKDYDMLLGLLVQELSELTTEDTRGKDGAEMLRIVFQRLSERTCKEYEHELDGKDVHHRLGALMNLLTARDFSPEVEVVDGTVKIRLLNCPFRSVALLNRAVCSFDSNLISGMLDVGVERDACIHDGDLGCSYTAQLSPTGTNRLPARA